MEFPDGRNVTGGTGAHDANYITDALNTTTYYRAEVTQPEYAPAYSTPTTVSIIPFPDDAGPISGIESVCEGTQGQIYIIQSIPNATSYDWILPSGLTGSSTLNFIQVDFESGTGLKEIQVRGKNGECAGVPSSIFVTVNPNPVELILDSLAQPTCTIPTGTIYLSNLPATGNWTLNDLSDSTEITGTGSEMTIQDLLPGTYQYEVINEFGCSLVSSQVFTLNASACYTSCSIDYLQCF
jgi:hypothetical protein